MDGVELLSRVQTDALRGRESAQSRKAILVVGMSRSGTSLITHILHSLGMTLPCELNGGAHGNPLGHWEPKRLNTLNEAILQSVGRPWDDPRPLPERWLRSRQAYQCQQRIVEEIRQSYVGADLATIKDPRLCRLLPLYLEALDILDVEPLIILQVRPVEEIAQSLLDRDGLHPGLSELLWLRSLVEAECYSRSCRRIWVSFDQVKSDWQETASRIANGLGVTWPVAPDEAARRVSSIVKPHRHRFAPAAAYGRSCPGRLHGLAARAWDAVEEGLANDEVAARAAFDRVRAGLEDADRIFLPSIANLLDRREAELAAIRGSTCWRMTAPLRAMVNWVARRGMARRN